MHPLSSVCLTNQTIATTLHGMIDSSINRLLEAYPAIYLACHRQHLHDDERGRVITDSQANVLAHLSATRPMTLSVLAGHLDIGKSAMSIAVSRLVRHGYVKRVRARTDARSIQLTLTAAGVKATEQNAVLDRGLVREMFRLIPPAELQAALHGIELLARYSSLQLARRAKRGRR
jgi:DNA-binding MarR family transcriptional regulator